MGAAEVRFHQYIQTLGEFQEKIGNIPVDFSAMSEPVGIPKEVLFGRLTTSLLNQGYSTEDLNKIEEVYRFAHNKFQTTPGREKRSTGDETITHALWMANLLAENGITDVDVQMATILHDVHEDTDT
ncbi:MAG: hypothetical protein M1426_04385, partial [Patescibacteria group bacterium]|nr:hypothetical protein [Patescibacteria group bacterium]